jgi:hypothetical protein
VAGIDEQADGHRHLALVDQVVEHDRRAELAALAHIGVAVLKYHQRRVMLAVILRRHVNPVAPDRAGKDFAVAPHVLGDLALRHALLTGRVGAEFVANVHGGFLAKCGVER